MTPTRPASPAPASSVRAATRLLATVPLPALVALVAALTLISALTLAGCTSRPGPQPSPSAEPTADLGRVPEAIATRTDGLTGGPVPVPPSGAYLGSWVRPADLSQDARREAVSAWESSLGRPLDIVHTYRKWNDEIGTTSDLDFIRRGATLMLSWAGADTRETTSGRYDDLIRDRARRIKALGKPVLLRYRWEMDRPNLQAQMWSPADYVEAWKHVRTLFAAESVTNAAWVWCPTATGFETATAPAYYPGDDQVDWTCVDVYSASRFRPLGDLLHPFLTWAAAHPKPIIVGEFGIATAYPPPQRAAWLRDAAEVFRANPQIKAVSYFESNPDSPTPDPHQQFALRDHPEPLHAFTALAHDPYFNPVPHP